MNVFRQIWDIYGHCFLVFSPLLRLYYACDCILHVIFACFPSLLCRFDNFYWYVFSFTDFFLPLQICSFSYCIVCFRTGLWFFYGLYFLFGIFYLFLIIVIIFLFNFFGHSFFKHICNNCFEILAQLQHLDLLECFCWLLPHTLLIL